eukprot:5978956-Amphidinium_carterae.1
MGKANEAMKMDKANEATKLCKEQHGLFKEAKQHEGEALLLLPYARALTNADQASSASTLTSSALQQFEALGERRLQTIVVRACLVADLATGSQEQAEVLAKKYLPAFREYKDKRGEAIVNETLASLAMERGDYEAVVGYGTRAVMLYRQLSDQVEQEERQAQKLINAACCYLGKYDSAPFRAEAKDALAQLAEGIEQRDSASVRSTMEKLTDLQAYTFEEFRRAVLPVMKEDKEGAQ